MGWGSATPPIVLPQRQQRQTSWHVVLSANLPVGAAQQHVLHTSGAMKDHSNHVEDRGGEDKIVVSFSLAYLSFSLRQKMLQAACVLLASCRLSTKVR